MMAADFLDEVGVVETASRRPLMAYRVRNQSQPVFFLRTLSPRGGE
jgi:8-oxo-dGTP diphosphatase